MDYSAKCRDLQRIAAAFGEGSVIYRLASEVQEFPLLTAVIRREGSRKRFRRGNRYIARALASDLEEKMGG